MAQIVTVRKGDTLTAIAKRYGMNVLDIVSQNPQFRDPNLIRPGDTVYVSGQKSTPDERNVAGNRIISHANVALPSDPQYVEKMNAAYKAGSAVGSPYPIVPEIKVDPNNVTPQVQEVLDQAGPNLPSGYKGPTQPTISAQYAGNRGLRASPTVGTPLPQQQIYETGRGSLRYRLANVQPPQQYQGPSGAAPGYDQYRPATLTAQELQAATAGPSDQYAQTREGIIYNTMRFLDAINPFTNQSTWIQDQWEKHQRGEPSFYGDVGMSPDQINTMREQWQRIAVDQQNGRAGTDIYSRNRGRINGDPGDPVRLLTEDEKIRAREEAARLHRPLTVQELLGIKIESAKHRQDTINAQADDQIRQNVSQAVQAEYGGGLNWSHPFDQKIARLVQPLVEGVVRGRPAGEPGDGPRTPAEAQTAMDLTGMALYANTLTGPYGTATPIESVLPSVISYGAANGAIIQPQTQAMKDYFKLMYGVEGFNSVAEFMDALGYTRNENARDPYTGEYTGAWVKKSSIKSIDTAGNGDTSYVYGGPQLYPYAPQSQTTPTYSNRASGGYGGPYMYVLWRIRP